MISSRPPNARFGVWRASSAPRMPALDCHSYWERKIMCVSFAPAKIYGVLAKYAHTVTSASLGAVTDADLKL
ncbi:MAG TPA: hypothetical protein VIK53_10415 [Verrucomicrobiae bacterium]